MKKIKFSRLFFLVVFVIPVGYLIYSFEYFNNPEILTAVFAYISLAFMPCMLVFVSSFIKNKSCFYEKYGGLILGFYIATFSIGILSVSLYNMQSVIIYLYSVLAVEFFLIMIATLPNYLEISKLSDDNFYDKYELDKFDVLNVLRMVPAIFFISFSVFIATRVGIMDVNEKNYDIFIFLSVVFSSCIFTLRGACFDIESVRKQG